MPRVLRLLAKRKSFAFKIRNALLECPDDGIRSGHYDLIQHQFNLAFQLQRFLRACQRYGLRLCRALGPSVLKHCVGHIDEGLAGRGAIEQRSEFPLNPVARNGFAIPGTGFLKAHVIRVFSARLACGPASRKWLAAFITGHHAPQRKVRADVFTRRRPRRAVQTLLNSLERLQAHKRFVLALPKRDVPFRLADISCVNGPRENQVHDGVRHIRKARMNLHEPAHLSAGLESTARKPFEGVLNDRRVRLIPNQHFAFARLVFMAITTARIERPIAVHQTTAHAAFGLLSTFFALMLRHRHEHAFDE